MSDSDGDVQEESSPTVTRRGHDRHRERSGSSGRRRGGPPQRSKSDIGSRQNLPRSSSQRRTRRGTRNEYRQSNSDHDKGDDWFTFEDGQGKSDHLPPNSSSRHSSLHESTSELSASSFHADDGPSSETAPRPSRPGIGRSTSMRKSLADRRKEFQKVQSEIAVNTGVQERGISRTMSGTGPRRHRPQMSAPPTRHHSHTSRRDLMKAQLRSGTDTLQSNRDLMKAQYRVGAENLQSSRQLGGLRNSSNHDSLGGSSHGIESVSTDHSESSTPSRPSLARTMSGLEGGALNAVILQRQAPQRTKSGDSLAGANGGAGDKRWLDSRASKQDEIMNLAIDVRERFEEQRDRHEREAMHASSDNLDVEGKDDDDDQPMAMRTKKTALEQLGKVLTKTGAATRSLGKGTVNAISDPKLAAKRFGHLSKDVGKATIKTAMDPMKVAKATKNVTVGSAKMGAGLTKGVAKSTFGATKSVVKGGMSATTTGAKLTMKGTKKVVKGTVRAVKGKDKHSKHDAVATYDSRDLAERDQSSFYDRIAHMVETTETTEDIETAAAEAAARSVSGGVPKKGGSVLMPTNLLQGTNGSWDV
eukprot:Nitzschia sp. Nitz4//scaffold103_size77763//9784//11634//NITZ4_005439-RA/size77763-snap-gene-0.51-mRNA-1//1//CDS//3329532310//4128//frame0